MATFAAQLKIFKEELRWADLAKLKRDLTLYPTNAYATDDVEPVELFYETNESISIPRNYGLKYAAKKGLKVYPKFEHPEVLWPVPCGVTWRPGQYETIEKTSAHIAKYWGGLIDASTGCGKTLMAMTIAAKLNVPILVLMHKKDLRDNWHRDAEKFFPGVNCGHVQGDKWDYKNKHVTTALYQTLYSRRDKLPEDFLKYFGMVVIEEGHRVAAPTFSTVLSLLPAKYRLGISATWRRKDGMDMLFDWHIGDVAHRMTQTQLSASVYPVSYDAGFRSNSFIHPYTKQLNTAQFLTAISRHAPYNAYLADQCVRAVSAGRKVLLIGDRRKQLDDIQSRLSSLHTAQYTGSTKAKGRDEARKAQVILGTYQAIGEGTDIPELDTLIFATPRSDITQVVGRIRRPSPGKKPPLVLDPIIDHFYTRNLYTKRLQQYRSLGFEVLR